jgi:hypothetical protein
VKPFPSIDYMSVVAELLKEAAVSCHSIRLLLGPQHGFVHIQRVLPPHLAPLSLDESPLS